MDYLNLSITPIILVAEWQYYQYECATGHYYLMLHPDVNGYLQN